MELVRARRNVTVSPVSFSALLSFQLFVNFQTAFCPEETQSAVQTCESIDPDIQVGATNVQKVSRSDVTFCFNKCCYLLNPASSYRDPNHTAKLSVISTVMLITMKFN
jgi:hypothetical protein